MPHRFIESNSLTLVAVLFACAVALPMRAWGAGAATQPATRPVLALPREVSPTDANIRYAGRFDLRDAAGPRGAWPACTATVRFSGTALNARIQNGGGDWIQVIVDGRLTDAIHLEKGAHVYTVAAGLTAGEHTVSLVKRTEAFAGVVQFAGFQLEQTAKLLPVAAPTRRIEVIGDSISCGYGNEGKSQNEHFTAPTENGALAYGAVAARALNAEYVCVAWSGKKMWPDNTIPELYDLTLPQDRSSTWDFARWTPDVVLINLATNDFGHGIPEEKGWTTAYIAFIERLRKVYPDAQIYLATGSMMSDAWVKTEPKPVATLKAYLAKIVEARKSAGDVKVRTIDFDPQDMKNGIGADWHPSVKTHQLMADKLVKTLRGDMGW